MFLRVATVITLISVSAGEYATHLQPLPSKHAHSSQSYHRDDVPLSYKFSAVHIYTSPKPLKAGHEPHIFYQPSKPNLDPRGFRSIQYAPLLNPHYNKITITRTQKTSSNPKEKVSVTTSKKDHLEPKLVSDRPDVRPPPLTHIEYIPGQNIRVMQSANRIPGHNAVYNSYSENAPKEKINKVNYLRQYIVYQNAQRKAELATQNTKNGETTTTTTVNPLNKEFALVPLLRPITQMFSGPKLQKSTRDKPKSMDSDLLYKSPPQKMHALFLNVARSYNFVPAGLHRGANTSSVMEKSQPLLRLSRLSKFDIPPQDSKTLLHPMQKSIHYPIARMSQ